MLIGTSDDDSDSKWCQFYSDDGDDDDDSYNYCTLFSMIKEF